MPDYISLEQFKKKYCQNFVNVYSGTEGFLNNKDGKELSCKFEVGQLENGEMILICDFSVFDLQKCFPKFHYLETSSVSEIKTHMADYSFIFSTFCGEFKNFRGETSDKLMNITGVINLFFEIDDNSINDHNSERIKITYSLEKLAANTNINEDIQYVKFGVTNFIFGDGDKLDKVLSLNIKGVKGFRIEKNENYEDASKFLMFSKGIRVTCDIIVENDIKTKMKDLEEIVCDLCDLMSIVWGTRIQWIYYCAYSSEGEIVSREHVHRVTKPFNFNKIISTNSTNILETFLESSYISLADKSNILRDEEETAKPLINAYLDAKAESDYLEGRGIKLVVVMEMLKKSFLKRNPELEYIITNECFENISKKLEGAFKKVFLESTDSNESVNSIDSNLRKKFYANIKGINRTSFFDILSRFCDDIKLPKNENGQKNEEYLRSIVASRNNLIHNGNFLCNSDKIEKRYKEIKDYPQFQDSEHECFFLMNFVDKCFLKLLHYKGNYYKWESATEGKDDKLL